MTIGKGCVIAIGGNEDKRGVKAILRTFVERAGGRDARIVVIPSASAEPQRRGNRYAAIFQKLGAESVHIVRAELGVSSDELTLITNATGIFVTGGDQERLMAHLRTTGCDAAIVEAVRSGAVYAGTSAGAAAISATMITGSLRRRGGDVVHLSPGLGLVRDVVIDQHFSERRRLPRLVKTAREQKVTGVGIDENTAMIFEPNGEVAVTGAGGVTVIRPEHDSLRLHLFLNDDTFALD